MVNHIKKVILSNYYLRKLALMLLSFKSKRGGAIITNKGKGKLIKDVIGADNTIEIGSGTYLEKTIIRIRGNNNHIVFGDNCFVGKECSFWMEGNNITIIVGSQTTFTWCVHFCAQEDNQRIDVGEDCMFSNTIIVRTSDSHPIYDESGNRINMPQSVKIGRHVWIAPNTKVLKGAIISDGCIIGSNSLVTKSIPANCLAVGSPAKVIRENIKWTREKLF